MKKRRSNFNFVEILLALGVATIGIVALVGVLPVAVKASSEAVADSYAADAADMLFAVLDARMNNDSTAWDATADGDDGYTTTNFDTERPFNATTNEPQNVFKVTGSGPLSDIIGNELSNTTRITTNRSGTYIGSDIYRYVPYKSYVYVARDENDNVEFAANVLVWAETAESSLDIIYSNTETDPPTIGRFNANKDGLNYIRVFAEVSWPLNAKEYKNRTTRLYVREYYRPEDLL